MPVSIFRWQRMRTPRRAAVACSARAADGVEMVGVSCVIEDAVEIADAQRTEDEDRGADAGLAQHDPFLDVGAREHRGAFGLERERRPARRRARRRSP